MKIFMRFMQHQFLLNLCILRYCVKFLMAFAKGQASNSKSLEVSSNGISNFKMGIYELDCCVRYAKKIRKELFSHCKDLNSPLEIEVSLPEEVSNSRYVGHLPINLEVFKKCISEVAEETGFKLTNQQTISYKVSYIFQMRSTI